EEEIRRSGRDRTAASAATGSSKPYVATDGAGVAPVATAKHLKTAAIADSASVQFDGKVQRIARVHHYGLRDRVRSNGPLVRYEKRMLLGVNNKINGMISEMFFK
ncbi:MAG: phage virion morphogenesis protein, partial [Klebsiella michiganensis]